MGSVITRNTVKANKDAPVEVTGSDIGNKRYQDTTAVIYGVDGVDVIPIAVNATGNIRNKPVADPYPDGYIEVATLTSGIIAGDHIDEIEFTNAANESDGVI